MNSSHVNKPYSIRKLCSVDVAPIITLLSKASEDFWFKEDERKENRFSCFHHTQHVVLRFIKNNQNHLDFYENRSWLFFEPILRPVFDDISALYGFQNPEYPKAMFARLKAGQEIDRHRDGAGSNLSTHKIHIPLQTNPGVQFFVGDDRFHLEQGIAYEVNNIRPHAVKNNGVEDRVHLIFECFENIGDSI